MAVDSSKAIQSERKWSQQLFACLQEMAMQDTNAVLLTLADADVFESERHYPESGLVFGNGRWRSFYHCHEDGLRHENEHGHFHIFTDVGNRQWAHVAALAIDVSGQPLHWFVVNRWVTDGPWLKLEQFLHQIQSVTEDSQGSLVERWLHAMLQLYQPDLVELLQQRDVRLAEYAAANNDEPVFDVREIYALGSKSIELQSMLEMHLLH
jgi:hypothetical protein